MKRKKEKESKLESFVFKFAFDASEGKFDINVPPRNADTNLALFFTAYLKAYLEGEDTAKMFGEAFIGSIATLCAKYPRLGILFHGMLLEASIETCSTELHGLLEEGPEGEEEEDCAHCEFVKNCDNEAAIAYRKANGIPRPKKSSKRNIDVK